MHSPLASRCIFVGMLSHALALCVRSKSVCKLGIIVKHILCLCLQSHSLAKSLIMVDVRCKCSVL